MKFGSTPFWEERLKKWLLVNVRTMVPNDFRSYMTHRVVKRTSFSMRQSVVYNQGMYWEGGFLKRVNGQMVHQLGYFPYTSNIPLEPNRLLYGGAFCDSFEACLARWVSYSDSGLTRIDWYHNILCGNQTWKLKKLWQNEWSTLFKMVSDISSGSM